MKILIACEFSGIVREAFKKKGHDVWSCDLLPTEIPGQHIQGDVLEILNDGWDMMIAHPPCTHLAVSGARHFKNKIKDGRQQEAIDFFMKLINAPINKICVENPICIMSSKYKKPTQIIRPFQFGENSTKGTCLWLKNLPLLKPTNIIEITYHTTKSGRRYDSWWFESSLISDYKKRSNFRSKTFQGIANAMAEQWG
jgi:site-specific DNA-cytosine methylase